MNQSTPSVSHFFQDDTAATMVEYGLMVALIALVCIGAVALVGGQLKSLFVNVKNSLQ